MGRVRDGLISRARDLYAQLKSGNAVAKQLAVSHWVAYQLLKEGGVRVPHRHSLEVQNRKKKLQGKVARSAARDYAKGISPTILEEKYKASIDAIRTAARDAGVPFRGRRRVDG